jgi:spore coat polysaccharide biosynthesis protein SpsF (cytidylyltransferase family)
VIPPLCIIQSRLKSTRLEEKMLLKLGGETLIARAWRLAVEAFGQANVVVAIPAKDDAGPLGAELRRVKATVFAWDGDEHDVLGRFWFCAHRYRWHPDTVIVRWTPDDWNKQPTMCLRVVAGERLPVEQGGEAFTLEMLDVANSVTQDKYKREHITYALFGAHDAPKVPRLPKGYWTIDDQADFRAARLLVEGN